MPEPLVRLLPPVAGSRGPTLVYRGPWQPNRIRLVLTILAGARGDRLPAHVIWLCPQGIIARIEGFGKELLRRFAPLCQSLTMVDGRVQDLPKARATVQRELVANGSSEVAALGLTALPAIPNAWRSRLTWYVQGIPEERLLHRDTPVDRALVAAEWAAVGVGRPPLVTVVVSDRMADLVSDRLGIDQIVVAPNSIDPLLVDAARSGDDRPRHLCAYLGSGAPWQGVDRLAGVWSRLAEIRPTTRFRVISRDPRTDVLCNAVPGHSVEQVSASGPAEVASLLQDVAVGFLLRADHLANRVAWPVKLGEYLACGVVPFVSDLDWAPSDLVSREGCGVLAAPDVDQDVLASRIAATLDDADQLTELRVGGRRVAESLELEPVAARLERDLEGSGRPR